MVREESHTTWYGGLGDRSRKAGREALRQSGEGSGRREADW